jgi:outer membrane protein OmpA-like peptidoglycan-associated protein
MKTKLTILSAALALGMGCMHAPPMPEELVQARELYENQRTGTTGQVAPAALAEARKSIEIATASWEKNPKAVETKDFSYVALRKTQLAAAKANIDLALMQKDQIQRDRLSLAQLELQRTKDELARSNEALSKAGIQLEGERMARTEAERKANQAADELSKISQVKRDSRGVVLTLSGSVTFASGKSEILEGAQSKLDEVAQALIKSKPKGVVIEGHTDSQGSAEFNKVLSQQRADAVKNYLVGQGVPTDIIKAEGKGESKSIATNDTPEGRAMNRRVEIVVLKEDAVSAR